ncbi:LuxR family transcriptional regulator [Nocardia sp. NEAU-G5]|uniref:LuxR family transcriptional regulator n=1 Tax=Nocardia albiluteola TaxID=2842303 RepID=A0ABS6BED1_9NOCA|nr:LuxR family transcriptional regulator [Nocardia albiluteola]MBU3068161.1 LuxR family transcriptional regulator [Nocardia albiluteola]
MLYGRAEELALIDRLLADVRTGRSGAHVLSGPTGIGKSALLDYAATKAQGLRVIRVSGIELEAELPFAGLHLLLHPVLDRLGALPAPQAVALRSAFGLAPAQPGDRFIVGLAVLSMLAELAEDGPVLCLVDDAQWLDRSSTEALTFAARRLHHEGVLLLFAVRGDVRDTAGLTALGTRELTALDPDTAATLLDELHPELAPPVRARMLAETGGNPLALVELPSALSAEQRTGTAPAGSYDLATLPLTTRVQTAFGARAVGLDDAATALLLIAATEETGRLEIVLAAAAAYHAGPAELTRVEDSGLLVRHDDRVTFRHPLARAAVLGAAPAHRRMEAHRALATALAMCGTIEADDRAAWHRAAAATGPDDDIAAALEAAADRASDRGDHALAAAAMERAAAMTVDPVGGTRRLTCAAKAAAAAGDLRRTAALVRRAARGPLDERDAPHLDHLRAIVESEFGSRRHAARMLIDTADRAPADLAGTMLVDAIRNGVLVGDPELTERAATMLQRRRGRTPISEGMIGIARMLGGDDEAALHRLHACAAYAHSHSAELSPDERMNAAAMGLMTGLDVEARDLLTALVAEGREQFSLRVLPMRLHYLASAEYATGHHRDATVHAEEGLALADSVGQHHQMDGLRSILAWGAAQSGDELRCREFAEPTLAAALDRGELATALLATAALGLLDLGAGRYDRVLDRIESASRGPMGGHYMSVFFTPMRVEAAMRTGQPERIGGSLERLRRWADASRSPWIQGVYARCLAQMSSGDEAEAHFAAAVRLHEKGDRPLEAARSDLLYGEWLRRARRKTEARTRLRAALETFERIGAKVWADRARAELRATGDTGRQPAGASVLDLLTPQELQVVRLAARGLSNRDIGGQLFLSPRTVGYHLYKAYPKLGVAVRAELSALLDQL